MEGPEFPFARVIGSHPMLIRELIEIQGTDLSESSVSISDLRGLDWKGVAGKKWAENC